MSASAELTRLLEQWRQLTEREAHSILLGDWQALTKCQAQKQRLTQDINRARASFKGAAGLLTDEATRNLVAELKALENRNLELLSAKRQNLQAELDRINGSSRALHGVRRAYGTDAPNLWHSYS